jgi:outer membrane protein OmpA-like peptidoglycan-associated protein
VGKVTVLFLSLFISLGSFAQDGEGNCGIEVSKKAVKKFTKLMDEEYPINPLGTIKEMKLLVEKYPEYPDMVGFIAGHYRKGAYKPNQPHIALKVRKNAIRWYKKLSRICPEYRGHTAYFWVGRLNHEIGEDSVAAVYFKKYLDNEQEPPKEMKSVAQLLVDEYYVKDYLISHPVPFDPKVVRGVSSKHDEYLPMLSPDNNWLYFTRKRNTKPDIKLPPNTPGNDDKEYFSKSRAILVDSFSYGMVLRGPFNKHLELLDDRKMLGIGGACLTPDNKTMYITVTSHVVPQKAGKEYQKSQGYKNTDLYVTKLKQGSWTPLKSAGPGINDESNEPTWEGQPTISSDGKMMIFSSARLSSISFDIRGQEASSMDLFVCLKDDRGNWGAPKGLGPMINTPGHERTPFLHSDSKTLYFSSDGHPGMGGSDIYYTRLDENDNWIRPINIGMPINTEKNEHGLIVSLDGKTAFLSSGESGVASEGGLQLISFPLYEKARPEKVVMMKGTLKDEKGDPVKNGKVSIKDSQTGKIIDGLVDEETGEYVVVMPVIDLKKPKVKPEKISLTVNGEEEEADYGSSVATIKGKEVIVPPGGKIVNVNNEEEVIRKDEIIAKVNGTEQIIKKSDKVRKIDGVDLVVSADHDVVDFAGEPIVIPKKKIKLGKEKQRFVLTATGDGKAFTTSVLEIDSKKIAGAKKIRASKPLEIQTIKKGTPIRLNDVSFSTSSSVLNGLCMDVLDELVVYLKVKPSMKISIHGHTDNRGGAQDNIILSKERAKQVMTFLISEGIDKSRLSYNGFGAKKPKESNLTEEGRAINRRVEFVILSM